MEWLYWKIKIGPCGLLSAVSQRHLVQSTHTTQLSRTSNIFHSRIKRRRWWRRIIVIPPAYRVRLWMVVCVCVLTKTSQFDLWPILELLLSNTSLCDVMKCFFWPSIWHWSLAVAFFLCLWLCSPIHICRSSQPHLDSVARTRIAVIVFAHVTVNAKRITPAKHISRTSRTMWDDEKCRKREKKRRDDASDQWDDVWSRNRTTKCMALATVRIFASTKND